MSRPAVGSTVRPSNCRNATHDWVSAREAAYDSLVALETITMALEKCVGGVLREDLVALNDVPAFRTAAMDGWAVAGPGPWQVSPGILLAGMSGAPLLEGTAISIATGAALPATAEGVLRREDGLVVDGVLSGRLREGLDYLPAGGECRVGDRVLPAGQILTPPAVGLAAACGHDNLHVIRRPTVEILILGDELLSHGSSGAARVRDSLGPQLPAWVSWLGGDPKPARRLCDELTETTAAVREAAAVADVVVTTGGTAAGPVDHLHAALRNLDADIVVDGVAARPGHPMVLALLPDGTPVVGLPGNPLSACVSALTLLAPMLARLSGRPLDRLASALLTSPVKANGEDVRLVPVWTSDDHRVTPVDHIGSAMLRGLSAADAVAVVPPNGADAGTSVQLIALPWADRR